MASQSLEAGDTTFTRSKPRSLDYRCDVCGTRITDWSHSWITEDEQQKLVLVGHCHGETETILVYLGMGGIMFRSEGD